MYLDRFRLETCKIPDPDVRSTAKAYHDLEKSIPLGLVLDLEYAKFIRDAQYVTLRERRSRYSSHVGNDVTTGLRSR